MKLSLTWTLPEIIIVHRNNGPENGAIIFPHHAHITVNAPENDHETHDVVTHYPWYSR